MPVRDAPRQRDLRAALAVFFPNRDERWVLDQFAQLLPGAVDGVLVAKGRVLLHVDSLALVEGGEGGLLEPGVAFELVRGGDDSGSAQEALELRFAEVGDADGARLAVSAQLLHRFPGVDVVGVAWFYLVGSHGHEGVAAGEGGGPVHDVEV